MGTITLPNFRTTSDITAMVRLKDGGLAIDWSVLTGIKAWLYSDDQRAISGRFDVSVDQENPTVLKCDYAATKPQYLGINRIIVQAKYDGRTKTYDQPLCNLVRWTEDQAGEQITLDDPVVDVEIEVTDVDSSILDGAIAAALDAADRAEAAAAAAEQMVDIHTGPAGKSAYEVAVDEGYTGTEEQWLASLKGETGDTPDISIGTVTTVEPGEPAEATMTGTPEAPVLNLSIPKGAVGATPNITVGTVTTGEPGTPVVVEITGTAEAPVLNITIPQGTQGNTGSSVEYPFELVNNLTTDDATKALSAAQGVVLDGKVSQLGQQVIYDVSANNDGATFASLSALLSSENLSTLIPIAVRCGGMSIRFVQSSDNKYVQCRLMSDEWSTDTDDWSFCGEDVQIESQGLLRVYTDKNNRILWAIKANGDIYFGVGVPTQVKDYVQSKISELHLDEYEDIVSFLNGVEEGDKTLSDLFDEKVDTVEGKGLIDEEYASMVKVADNQEYIEIKTDRANKAIEAITKDGVKEYFSTVKYKNGIGFCGVKVEEKNSDDLCYALVDDGNKIIESITMNGTKDVNIPIRLNNKVSILCQNIDVINSHDYLEVKVDSNGKIIYAIKTDGTICIESAHIRNLSNPDNRIFLLMKSLPIIVSGLDNVKISNDPRVMNLLSSVDTENVITVDGENIKNQLLPCISIIDDDTLDYQIPSSNGDSNPVSNRGGYFSVMLPFLLSLGEKHGKKLVPGLACEGHRVGFTPMRSSNDEYTVLNTNGSAVKWLHNNLGWNVFNHSMTAQLPQKAYYVEGITSTLAQTIISDVEALANLGNIVYYSPYNFNNYIVLDTLTGKWYELNTNSTNVWVERTPNNKYAMPFYMEYINAGTPTANHNGVWYFNRNFDFKYSWGEWCKRADKLGLPYEKVIVHNGTTASAYMISASRNYADFSIRTNGIHNYPPIAATVNRMTINSGVNGNVSDSAYKQSMINEIDICKEKHTWMIFMTHFNDSFCDNYYHEDVDYPSKDDSYSSEWIIPLNNSEIMDVIGSNQHHFLTVPPSRLGIQNWSEWHPAPGTKLKDFYDVIDYALSEGIDIVSPMDGWNTHGNMLNIGVDRNGQTYSYDSASIQSPYTDAEQSFLTIGSDGSIRYYSK